MAKRPRRRAFPTVEKDAKPNRSQPRPEKLIDTTSGVFGFFRDHGVRETIESIIVAVVLALMFRAYEAEAFIIPTGSMAPALQGEHMDVVCEECGYQYRAGASASSSSFDPSRRATVTQTWCPICRYGMKMKRNNPDHSSNNGDRILVNKFVYDFQPPDRFDVIVFKNPNNGKQNYIKRLIGLPGDRLLIENGDIYNFVPDDKGQLQKTIVRKPVDKVPVLLQLVDDTDFRSRKLKEIGWPHRWAQWSADDAPQWITNESQGKPFFRIEPGGDSMHWLRYRHLAPRPAFDEFLVAESYIRKRNLDQSQTPPTEWDLIEIGELPNRIVNEVGEVKPGPLIRDHYEYNDRRYRYRRSQFNQRYPQDLSAGSHWVGDLALQCDMEVESEEGTIAFDLVEGGVHFKCSIDIATGEATLSTSGDDGRIVFDSKDGNPPRASTSLKGPGRYHVRYAQVDDMVYLWINHRFVDFSGSSYTRRSPGRPIPVFSEDDPGDSEPLGVGAANASIRINRLQVYRDIYYVAPFYNQKNGESDIRNETGMSIFLLQRVYENPRLWKTPEARAVFDRPVSQEPMFELAAGQYFPMGDNSPASQDARIWDGPKYVDERFLIGRAMFIYWPHSLNRPVKFFPNFARMGFIR